MVKHFEEPTFVIEQRTGAAGVLLEKNNEVTIEVFYDISSDDNASEISFITPNLRVITPISFIVISRSLINLSGRSFLQKIYACDEYIIGSYQWNRLNTISKAIFPLDKCKYLFLDENYGREMMTKKPFVDDDAVFSIAIDTRNITFYNSVSYDHFGIPTLDNPFVSIEYQDPVELQSALSDAVLVTQFFSMCVGFPIYPRIIELFLSSSDEPTIQKSARFSYIPAFEQFDVEIRPRSSMSPFNFRTEEEQQAFIEALKKWIIRSPEYTNSISLFMNFLRRPSRIDSDALMNAMRWFEASPGTSTQSNATLAETLEPIVEAAVHKSIEIGRNDLQIRIRDRLRVLSSETSRDRLNRIIGRLRSRFPNYVDLQVEDRLAAAIRFRGAVAHGAFFPKSDVELHQFIDSVLATQFICFLLLIEDLNFTEDGMTRLSNHVIVDSYLLNTRFK